jgi:hypothetical protein
LGGGQ